MSSLDKIQSPDELRDLPMEELPALCSEIRELLVEKVSVTGGHLASNLGAVELMVAIHRVFNTAEDRLIFDVGHQCYVHKILTGRKNEMDSLRSFGGIAGFPKPAESIHDAFIAGHASNSVSVALGFARADKILGKKRNIIALIGDGALTGGLASEGLYDAGASGLPIIIILNDNGMAINPNVGGMAQYLSRKRLTPSYRQFKLRFKKILNVIPGGKAIYRLTSRMKDRLKKSILHCSMFEEMGLRYGGPVDGHDIARVEEVLNWAVAQQAPTLVHIITKKGKGYSYSEENPNRYHGVSSFDPLTGELPETKTDFSAVFGEAMCNLARKDSSICAVSAAMTEGTGLESFALAFPERYYDVGITEGHAVSMASGMAAAGCKPVFAVYSTFLQRSYDMLIHDTAIMNNHVVFAVDRAGLVGADGETHHGLFDVSYLSSVPGMTIFAPSSFSELRGMLKLAVMDTNGPVAIRYPRGAEGNYKEERLEPAALLHKGSDVAIITYGITVNDAIKAASVLELDGISASVIKIGKIFPLPFEELLAFLTPKIPIVVVEEVVDSGCIGNLLISHLSQIGNIHPIKLINVGNSFVTHGSVCQLRRLLGIDAEGIISVCRELILNGKD